MGPERPAAGFKFLIVDDSAFQRRLIAETLRAHGASHVDQAEGAAGCVEWLGFSPPDVLITDWDLEDGDGLDIVRRLRSGEFGPHLKRLPVIMVASRNKAGDIERARNGGIDEFLLRPFSTASLMARVDAVTRARREFIESVVYVGPCRRRKMIADYERPLRRLFDVEDTNADAPDVQIKKGLARMYAERISALLEQAQSRDGMRDLSLACAQLNVLSADLGERLLMTAAESLSHYVRGVGAAGDLKGEVVRAHLDAIVQLAELPNSQVEIRQTVTRELGVMVSKKLRQASLAAQHFVDI